MRNCFYCKVTLKKSQANEGLRDPKYGCTFESFFIFSPFFTPAGDDVTPLAGVICPPSPEKEATNEQDNLLKERGNSTRKESEKRCFEV